MSTDQPGKSDTATAGDEQSPIKDLPLRSPDIQDAETVKGGVAFRDIPIVKGSDSSSSK